MGLKIGYYFAFKGIKGDLVKKVANVAIRCKRELSIKHVETIKHIPRCTFERTLNWRESHLGYMMLLNHFKKTAIEKQFIALLEKAGDMKSIDSLSPSDKWQYNSLKRENDELWNRRKERIIRSGNGICLGVHVGKGCEPFRVILARLGKGQIWRGMDCTKTQYAEHFVEAHTLVIRMLDLCKEEGILEKVEDQGGYWETRNLNVLAENINASTEFMKMASKALTHIGEEKLFIVHNAIDHCANYMNIKDNQERSK